MFSTCMTLQNIFYVVGIVFMILYTLLLLAVVILLFYIKNKISQVYGNIEDKIHSVKKVVDQSESLAASMGAAFADTAVKQMQKIAKRK